MKSITSIMQTGVDIVFTTIDIREDSSTINPYPLLADTVLQAATMWRKLTFMGIPSYLGFPAQSRPI
jgi:hypothetical protein